MRSSNPIFKEEIYSQERILSEMPMTINGTLNKLFLLFAIFIMGASAVWYKFFLGHIDFVSISSVIAFIVGIISSFVISFFPKTSPFLTPIYAFAEGILLSAISCFFETLYPGIVIQAVAITFLCFFVMLFCYKSNIIRVTETFKKVLFTATISISVFYLISMLLIYVFKVNVPYFSLSADPFSIILNIVICGIACFNFILDFDFIEKGAKNLLPKYYEWYSSFGLILTIFWLYIEILRLLVRFASKR